MRSLVGLVLGLLAAVPAARATDWTPLAEADVVRIATVDEDGSIVDGGEAEAHVGAFWSEGEGRGPAATS